MPQSKALIKSTKNVYHSISFIICTFITRHYLYRFILCLHPEAPAKARNPLPPPLQAPLKRNVRRSLEELEYDKMRQMTSGKERWPRKPYQCPKITQQVSSRAPLSSIRYDTRRASYCDSTCQLSIDTNLPANAKSLPLWKKNPLQFGFLTFFS